MQATELQTRLNNNQFIIMDGGMGTEISRRGIPTDGPAWSGIANLTDDGIAAITAAHLDFINAGSQETGIIAISNTFRTAPNSIASPYLFGRENEATANACAAAFEAIKLSGFGNILLAGSAAPLMDCYTPSDTPDKKTLESGHDAHAQNLALAGVGLYLAETMITVKESKIALRAGMHVNLPVAISFCTNEGGQNLLSGENLTEAIESIERYNPLFIGINCVDIYTATRALAYIKSQKVEYPIAIYAQGDDRTSPVKLDIVDYQSIYVTEAKKWLELGAQIIGGCCGVTPKYIGQIARI